MKTKTNSTMQRGFTLVELLIAMTISIVVIGAIYQTYTYQLHTRAIQASILEMRQNLRTALFLTGRDIRMAGYNGSVIGIDPMAGIVQATASRFIFTCLADSDGVDNDADDTIDEYGELQTIDYALYDEDSDGQSVELGRTSDGETMLVADNIEQLQFLYTLSDDTETTTPTDAGDIKTVHLTLLARASKQDNKFVNSVSYECPPSSDGSITVWGPFDDYYHRMVITGTFLMRNMGI